MGLVYTPILATLGYVFSPDRQRVLLVHRNSRPDDAHHGKHNGLGGKLERDEDIIAGFIRELREEADIVPTDFHLAGTISWPGFGKKGEDWFGFLFRVLAFTGAPPPQNADGPLRWHDVARVMDLPMWDGDRFFLPLILNLDEPTFHGVMPYRDGKPVSWQFSRLRSQPI